MSTTATIKALRPDDFRGRENDGDNPMTAPGQEGGPSDVNATGADERAARWQKENAEAIACYNDYIEKNGLPLDEFRMF
ncbi:type II toxin-antitoxin system CcdA family antitoxin [Paraburkholderia sp. BL23I1N1]|uniref:type II toxin-antitoxin system CcdA family antitoxin n=1 Tax=Paraburkholderia sp. BL23I1N1 TaxID=1938802 RepID=UPI00217CDDCC|nr:type II toxin-antitoxin system CcdA family antitoxin [Paraburkholderia sp. BL23I1N1]